MNTPIKEDNELVDEIIKKYNLYEVVPLSPEPKIYFNERIKKAMIEYAAAKQPPLSVGEDAGVFLEYISNERDNLVKYVNSLFWNTDLRMRIENILITYDQLKERYKAAINTEKRFTLKDIEDAFDAGMLHEYEKHFGAVPPLTENKEQYINNLKEKV